MRKNLKSIMEDLLNGEVVVVNKDGNTVVNEIFLDDDGNFKLNSLTNTSATDKYDQTTIGGREVLKYLFNVVL